MTHVAHLTVVHRPDDTRILHRECRTLAGAGYRVSLVAPGRHAATDLDVAAVPIPHFTRRLARVRRAAWGHPALLATALRLRASLYHVHDPELLLVAVLLKRLRGAKIVYDAHEDFRVRVRSREWLPRRLRGAAASGIAALERFASPHLDGVVVAHSFLARRFPGHAVSVVRNLPLAPGTVAACSSAADRDGALILYTGGVTTYGGVAQVAAALALVGHPGARLVVLGGHRDAAAMRALSGLPGARFIDLLGQVPLAEVYEWMARAAIGVVCQQRAHGYEAAEPTKLYEYMAAGLPVVASDSPPWSDVVVETGCGLTVDPSRPDAIAAAIDSLLANPGLRAEMGERGRRAVAERLNWESQGAVLLELYRRLVGPARG